MATATAPSKICALVPVKRLGWAKSRLAPQLTADERNCLAQAMLRDVLDVLSKVPQLGGIAVITPDSAVASIGNDYGAAVIDDLDDAGINNAVRRGQRELAAEGYTGVLVVPADIPFLSVQEVEQALSTLAECNVVITPANRDGGTNMLGFSPPNAMDPSFGLHSFRRHLAIARAMSLEVVVLPLEGAGHDIDVPTDLWLDTDGPAIQTRRLLARLGKSVPPACSGLTQEPLLP